MTTSFRLVPDSLPQDTIGTLERLLAQARRGMVLGMAFGVMYKGRKYIVNATGEVRRSPTFARGMVAELSDELHRLIHTEE